MKLRCLFDFKLFFVFLFKFIYIISIESQMIGRYTSILYVIWSYFGHCLLYLHPKLGGNQSEKHAVQSRCVQKARSKLGHFAPQQLRVDHCFALRIKRRVS